MKRTHLNFSESDCDKFTFNEIWSDYKKYFLNQKKILDLGGEQKIEMVAFPEILYSKIHNELFPGLRVESPIEFKEKEIENLNFLFGEGVFQQSGWCWDKRVSSDNNTHTWWIIRIMISFQPMRQKLIFTIHSLKSQNGKLLTQEKRTKNSK